MYAETALNHVSPEDARRVEWVKSVVNRLVSHPLASSNLPLRSPNDRVSLGGKRKLVSFIHRHDDRRLTDPRLLAPSRKVRLPSRGSELSVAPRRRPWDGGKSFYGTREVV